jgi:hypothetical protein
MSTAETVSVIVMGVRFLLDRERYVLARGGTEEPTPIGTLIECNGVRLRCLDGGDPAARCVVLFHGNGPMILDFTISGLARRNRVLCFDGPGFGL